MGIESCRRKEVSNEGDEGAVVECATQMEEEESEGFNDEEDGVGRGYVDVKMGNIVVRRKLKDQAKKSESTLRASVSYQIGQDETSFQNRPRSSSLVRFPA
jgi:hypothetical protein